METQLLRKTIHELIERIDDKELLSAYLKIIEQGAMKKSEIIGYTTKGEPITPETLKKSTRAASNRVKRGDYISQEELEKESEGW
jgi:hypothetical protein